MKAIKITGIIGYQYRIPNGYPNNSSKVVKIFFIEYYEILEKTLIIKPEEFNYIELIDFISKFESLNPYDIELENIFLIETCISKTVENHIVFNVNKIKVY